MAPSFLLDINKVFINSVLECETKQQGKGGMWDETTGEKRHTLAGTCPSSSLRNISILFCDGLSTVAPMDHTTQKRNQSSAILCRSQHWGKTYQVEVTIRGWNAVGSSSEYVEEGTECFDGGNVVRVHLYNKKRPSQNQRRPWPNAQRMAPKKRKKSGFAYQFRAGLLSEFECGLDVEIDELSKEIL